VSLLGGQLKWRDEVALDELGRSLMAGVQDLGPTHLSLLVRAPVPGPQSGVHAPVRGASGHASPMIQGIPHAPAGAPAACLLAGAGAACERSWSNRLPCSRRWTHRRQVGGLAAAGHSPGVLLLDAVRDRIRELGPSEVPAQQVRALAREHRAAPVRSAGGGCAAPVPDRILCAGVRCAARPRYACRDTS
jgi:hypothetical protein